MTNEDQALLIILLLFSVLFVIGLIQSMREANRKIQRFFDEWQADFDDEQ
jgi:hypothetical protein